VTGLEPDPVAADRAVARVAGGDVEISLASFEEFDPGTRRFQLITFVASLHHMNLRTSLARARDLLAPGAVIRRGLYYRYLLRWSS
jgi:hypothetical protein